MKSSAAYSIVKILTFAPIGILLYYSDFARWYSEISTAAFTGVFVAGLTIFALGLYLKRKIIGTYSDLARTSSVLGVSTLILAVGVFYYALATQSVGWLHFESMLLLVASYVSFRFDYRIVKVLTPLFVILSLALGPPYLQAFLGQWLYVLSIIVLILIFFILFANFNLQALLVPILSLVIGTLLLVYPGQTFLLYLVPVPLVAYLPPKSRHLLGLRSKGMPPVCSEHMTIESGFCLVCGRKVGSASSGGRAGISGLILITIVVISMIFIQIPALVLANNVPYSISVGYSGISSKFVPSTPSGWLLNSSTILPNYNSDVYATRNVYVPSYHPERMNYTLTYELASATPYVSASFGTIPGWTRNSQPLFIGPFGGQFIMYNRSSELMLVFTGVTRATFLNGFRGNNLNIGVTFVRNFTGVALSTAVSNFQDDINSIWVPIFQSELQNAIWSAFFNQLMTIATLMRIPLFTIAGGLVLVWGTYKTRNSELQIDKSLTKVSELENDDWLILSLLMKSSESKRLTAYEIADIVEKHSVLKSDILGNTVGFVKRLRSKKLAEEQLFERGEELLSEWKVF